MSIALSSGARTPGGMPGSAERAQQTGLTFAVAATLDEVIAAWRLVYRAYLRIGLIDPNPFELHTTPRAVGPHTAVMIARLGDEVVGTLSAMLDNPGGLPLDDVYPAELAALRQQGCQLMELGLFADRREQLARSFGTVLELMRLATWFGLHNGRTDAVIGVHPRHAPFYQQYLGFDLAGPEGAHPGVKNNPVVLLRLNWLGRFAGAHLPAGLRYVVAETPVDPSLYRLRFRFRKSSDNASSIEQYLATKPGVHCMS